LARFYPPLRGGAGGKVSLRVGPKKPANPKPTRAGKRGVEVAQPPPRGSGGCAPKNLKGASSPLLPARHEWDPKRRQTLSPRGWANGGPGGEAPMAGGLGDVPPKNQNG